MTSKQGGIQLKYGVGIIGAGRVSHGHAQAVLSVDSCELIGVAEPDDQRRLAFCERYSCQGFSHYQELMEHPEVHLVMIGLPHHLHKEAAVTALLAGKHTFLEKPMALTLEECDAMIQASKRTGASLMIGHIHHFISQNRKAKELLTEGVIGQVVIATDTWYKPFYADPRPAWFLDRKMGGGMWWMNGAHLVDRICWLMDTRVRAVKAYVDSPIYRFSAQDTAIAFLELEGGRYATLHHCGYRKGVESFEAICIGTEGMLKLGKGVWISEGGKWAEVPFTPCDPFKLELAEFIHSIEAGSDPPVPPEYGRHIVEVLLACEESTSTGREVRLG